MPVKRDQRNFMEEVLLGCLLNVNRKDGVSLSSQVEAPAYVKSQGLKIAGQFRNKDETQVAAPAGRWAVWKAAKELGRNSQQLLTFTFTVGPPLSVFKNLCSLYTDKYSPQ